MLSVFFDNCHQHACIPICHELIESHYNYHDKKIRHKAYLKLDNYTPDCSNFLLD